jgi:hypothetical protein
VSWWLIVLLAWIVAIPLVTVLVAGVTRGGRLEDDARLKALLREEQAAAASRPDKRDLAAV